MRLPNFYEQNLIPNWGKDFLQDLPVVCFVVTQHSEIALSLCLRYSKTSSRRLPKK